jgi:hypothetical protein
MMNKMSHAQRRIWLCSTLFLAALVAGPAFSRAQDVADAKAQYRADITTLINNYAKSVSYKDFDALRGEVQAPFMNFNGTVTTLATVDDVVANYRKARDRMDANNDYGFSKPEIMRITALTDKSALVNIHWQVYKKDGSPLREGGEVMMVSKSTGSWKLSGAMHQDPPEFGKIY